MLSWLPVTEVEVLHQAGMNLADQDLMAEDLENFRG